MHSSLMAILAEPDKGAIRRETFQGTEHLVVPVVMLQEQVLFPANAESPELALASEFGRFPESWDGRPVVLDHPKRNGLPVSANSPDILEERALGQVFNTHLEDGRLKAEMWINLEKAKSMGEAFQSAVERLENAEELTEVSTGLFTNTEAMQGVFNGDHFEGVWRDVVPDHLAVLPEGMIGACSVADGCGAPRVNRERIEAGESVSSVIMSQKGEIDVACSCGATKSGACTCATTTEDDKGLFQTMLQKFGHLLTFKSAKVKENSSGLSDRDRWMALGAALSVEADSSGDSDEKFFYVVSVFEDTFVFERGFSGKLLERSFSIREDGTVELGDDMVEVRPMVQFVPVSVAKMDEEEEGEFRSSRAGTDVSGRGDEREGQTMSVDLVISSKANGFTEEDREFLEGLEEGQLAKFLVETEEADVTTNSQEEETEVTACTVDDYIAQAPSEIQEVLGQGLRMQQQRRSELIKGIKENKANQYSEEELKEMSLAYLEKLGALAMGPSYEGAGAVRTQAAAEDDSFAPPMPEIFKVNGSEKADA